MARKTKTSGAKSANGTAANLGFEAKLWAAADKMRGHMDASEYKHVALGLIFLKYISDAFQELYDDLQSRHAKDYTDPEDRDEYAAKNVFWVPPEARWQKLQDSAKQPSIGKLIDDAMVAIERDIAIYGQESNSTTWRLAKMNLAIRGIDANLGPHHADSFHHDVHPDLKADYILANPPFNMSDWGGERLRDDKRWAYGVPPVGNANYAWIQHFIHHLAPATKSGGGIAGFVLANGSMSSNQSGEGEIRQSIVEADLVDCMIALPGQLFYTTGIPVCLWFLTRSKGNAFGPSASKGGASTSGGRDRRGQTLFIDARKLGSLIDRTHRELSDDEIARIAKTYHAWRGEKGAGGFKAYADAPGFCKSASLDEIKSHGYVLTPGRYVGAEDVEDDGEPFEEKMQRLTATLNEQFAESAKLEKTIRANLAGIGYGDHHR